jgi:hypothetical protein
LSRGTNDIIFRKAFSSGALLNDTQDSAGLSASLMDLHHSVNRLIKVIQENAADMDRGAEVLDKLPMLDFYNDDLLRNIEAMRNGR